MRRRLGAAGVWLAPQLLRATPVDVQRRELRRIEEDVDGDRSDRLIDAVFAHGDERAIAARVWEHLDAGTDHVLLAPIGPGLTAITDDLLRLAPALRETACAGSLAEALGEDDDAVVG